MITWSGIGRYTQNLIKAIYEQDSFAIQPYLFYNNDCEHNDLIAAAKQKKAVDTKVFSLLGARQLASKIGNTDMDLYHSPHFVLPSGKPKYPQIITIHDLTPLIVTGTMPNILHRTLYYSLNRVSCAKATRIIAPSVSTKQDIIRFFNVDEGKIDVVYQALDSVFEKASQTKASRSYVEEVKDKLAIRGKYIFALGNQKPNKGLEYLIDAFAELKNKNAIEHKLVLTGTPDKRFQGVSQRIEANRIGEHVSFVGKVSDSELVALYSGASACMFPSLYEGFGLPPLESMVCETPVLASNLSCIPEVVGDAALKVDPTRTDEFADAILRITTDSDCANDLVAKGLKQYKLFSHKRFTKETIAVYKRALS
jgi:glycosyltransferase involved in cell wall biosynthesis